MDYLPVVYSTPSAAAVADFVSTHYDLSNAIECKLLYRGWNEIFEVRTDDEALKLKDGDQLTDPGFFTALEKIARRYDAG